MLFFLHSKCHTDSRYTRNVKFIYAPRLLMPFTAPIFTKLLISLSPYVVTFCATFHANRSRNV